MLKCFERLWKVLHNCYYNIIIILMSCILLLQALLRESWLADMTSVLKESVIPSNNIFAVEAATKRHEAITADVMARVSCIPESSLT